MRSGFRATLWAVGCVLVLLPAICRAQIVFIRGPQRAVPNGPQFAAHGDFNNDGLQDAVLTNTLARNITLLYGSPDGIFESAISTPVGQLPRGLAVADFNGDRNMDITVVDVIRSRVFIINGNGDGTISPSPASYAVDRRGPYDVAAGDFDNRNGPDIVTANSVANTINILINRGRNTGFTVFGPFPVGRNPRAVETADFNGDGFDDIIVLNTGARGTDEVAVMLNKGAGAAGTFTDPVRFVTGKGATAVTVNDFNDDGVLDLAVLNGTEVAPATFSISILVNQTQTDAEGNRVGTGFFSSREGFTLSCPARINLVPVRCFPQDIKSADFNRDGVNDIVISVRTTSAENSSVTAGFISAFAGRGDGTFDFSTQIIVGLGPRQMTVGDFTGDACPDVVATEYSNNSVSLLRAVCPPPRDTGQPCRLGTDCKTTFCVNGVCCGTASCPAGQFCNIPGQGGLFGGMCASPGPSGTPCEDMEQCESGFCVDDFCCDTPSCPEGQFCNTGMCQVPSPNGRPCSQSAQCASGNCTDGVCCERPACPTGQRCDIAGSEGMCTSPSPNGTPCVEDEQCISGNCTDGVCCQVDQCPSTETCNAPGQEGHCAPRPTATATATPTPTPQPNGTPCSNGSQCQSGFCTDGVCCSTGSCPSGQRCDITGAAGQCAPRRGEGQECAKDSDCVTDNCQPGTPGTCGSVRTPTPTRTPTPRGPGEPCDDDFDCEGDLLCNIDEFVCCDLDECPAGQSCTVPGRAGECAPIPTPTRTPTATPTKAGPGVICDPNDPDACASGFCTDDVCCETDLCEDDDRCDIFGFEGECHPPLDIGDECRVNTDCLDPLLCLFNPSSNVFECTVPPEPTPTLIPLTPEPTPLGPEVQVSRGGGCSIGARPDGSSVWVLVTLPVFLLWRRRQLHGAVVQRRRRPQ